MPRRTIGIDVCQRRHERLGALPEPWHPIGVGIRARPFLRRCAIEHGSASPAVDTAQMSRESGEVPPRTRCDRGVERTSLERYREPIDVGPDVVEVRLGDHCERR